MLRDKNKSVSKIKGLPAIYWINLDSDTHRREYMEDQFEYWQIENHTRISGYDGRTDDICQHIVGAAPDQVCLLYTSPSPRDATLSRMPSSA